MIAYLTGQVQSISGRFLVLNVNSVGYAVFVTSGLKEKASIGDELELFIHTNVREDDISLYGFASAEDLALFKLLLSVSGVGPKSAMEILNAPIQNVRQAIAKKDAVWLTRLPGIGKKTAERIIIDLEGKIKEAIMNETGESPHASEHEDIVAALLKLGYQRNTVLNGLKKVPAEVTQEEAIIKYFLQNI